MNHPPPRVSTLPLFLSRRLSSPFNSNRNLLKLGIDSVDSFVENADVYESSGCHCRESVLCAHAGHSIWTPPPLLKHLRYDLEPDNGRLLRNETCTQSREQQPFQSFRINWHVRANSGGRKLLFKTLEIHFFFRILIFWIERWTRVIDFVRLTHPRWNAFANNTFCRKFWCMTSKTISANCN